MNRKQAIIKVTLSYDSSTVLVQYFESSNEWEFPADKKDLANLKPCESKYATYSVEDNILIIHY